MEANDPMSSLAGPAPETPCETFMDLMKITTLLYVKFNLFLIFCHWTNLPASTLVFVHPQGCQATRIYLQSSRDFRIYQNSDSL